MLQGEVYLRLIACCARTALKTALKNQLALPFSRRGLSEDSAVDFEAAGKALHHDLKGLLKVLEENATGHQRRHQHDIQKAYILDQPLRRADRAAVEACKDLQNGAGKVHETHGEEKAEGCSEE